jgi:hypothetical protein
MSGHRFNDVNIPLLMRNLPLDRRGYPIPIVVLRDTENAPHFTINNSEIAWRAAKEKRCAICGSDLMKARYWFIGGPLAAYHERGGYADGPVHKTCGIYAMQVCPYLAVPSYAKRIEGRTLERHKSPMVAFVDQTMLPDRPPLFVMARAKKYDVYQSGPAFRLKPQRPWDEILFWRDGEQIDQAAAMPIVDAALVNHEKGDQK